MVNIPSEPRSPIGDISLIYIGTSAVLRPQFNPIKNLPKIKHSKLLKNLLELSRVAPMIANTLLSKRPHFLRREERESDWLGGFKR